MEDFMSRKLFIVADGRVNNTSLWWCTLEVKRTSLCVVDGEEKSSPNAHAVSVHEANTQ